MRVICLALGPERTRKHLLTFLQGEMVSPSSAREASRAAGSYQPARTRHSAAPPPTARQRQRRCSRLAQPLAAHPQPARSPAPQPAPVTRDPWRAHTGNPPRPQELGKYMDEVLVAIAYNLGRCVEFIGPMAELPCLLKPLEWMCNIEETTVP